MHVAPAAVTMASHTSVVSTRRQLGRTKLRRPPPLLLLLPLLSFLRPFAQASSDMPRRCRPRDRGKKVILVTSVSLDGVAPMMRADVRCGEDAAEAAMRLAFKSRRWPPRILADLAEKLDAALRREVPNFLPPLITDRTQAKKAAMAHAERARKHSNRDAWQDMVISLLRGILLLPQRRGWAPPLRGRLLHELAEPLHDLGFMLEVHDDYGAPYPQEMEDDYNGGNVYGENGNSEYRRQEPDFEQEYDHNDYVQQMHQDDEPDPEEEEEEEDYFDVHAESDSRDLLKLYKVLGLEKQAQDSNAIDSKALKKVYRDLSIKYHPDKNIGKPNAAARFRRIRDAYDVLSNPVKALLYDSGGMELVKKYESNKHDIERTNDETKKVTISLEDLYKGVKKDIVHKREVICTSCRQHPDLKRCRGCKNCPRGIVMMPFFDEDGDMFMTEVEEDSEDFCRKETTTFPVAIEKGMFGDDTITHEHGASQRPNMIPGNLLVKLETQEHPLFKRAGNDLVIEVHITLAEALLGFRREVEHLDGHIVRLSTGKGDVVASGSGLIIDGEGMPTRDDPSSFGRLIVRCEIEFPQVVPEYMATDLESALTRLPGQQPKRLEVKPIPAWKRRNQSRQEL
eukprot:TRINITY_DN19947_c0_g1_i4.p1 TRINITY_DN19947_c0_g1~~TRINITY_DN19947_c0_g1_i4.p1  ORF type:complete len:624 (-),score=139.89 TRINITY_DN19947_c0_g1_i4:38-1909(-)